MRLNHLCNIWRKVEGEDPDTGETVFVPAEIATDIPCHLSYPSRGYSSNQGPSNEIKRTPKILVYYAADVKAGDKIIVTTEHGADPQPFKAGKPFKYPTHISVPTLEDGEA